MRCWGEFEHSFARPPSRGVENDHKPLDLSGLPQFLLGRVIGMSIEAGGAYSGEMPIIGLPLVRVAREFFLIIHKP